MNDIEIANQYASKMAGEYLEEIGITDLKDFNKHQWTTLIDVITKNYHLKKIDLDDD